MIRIYKSAGLAFIFLLILGFRHSSEIVIKNGWIVSGNRVIIGNGQRTDYWGGYKQCQGNPEWIHNYKTYTAITRNIPGKTGPCLTEDLDRLTSNMLKYGYPAFMHNYGLWYDRRRDCHDESMRTTPPEGPFHEMPWGRSDVPGAWDGGNRYDLLKYNPWYFNRIREFARQCDQKGALFIYQFYNQHHILESPCHYVDFPWRPVNCIQITGLPDLKPVNDLTVYNRFYDITDSVRRNIHRAYIRKCLDGLSDFSHVIFEVSREYTGPLSFTRFWLETIRQWEKEKNKSVLVSLGATKDVQDAILADPELSEEVDVINLAYWWYKADGTVNAPSGGKGIPGRYADGTLWAKETSAHQIYRQVSECRLKYPGKAIIHAFEGSREQSLAFMMGGGSILIRYLKYPDSPPPANPWDPPANYIRPENSVLILPFYNFIRNEIGKSFQDMTILNLVSHPDRNWCLGNRKSSMLVYASQGGDLEINLKDYRGKKFRITWVNPSNGEKIAAKPGSINGGGIVSLAAPDTRDWLLWMH